MQQLNKELECLSNSNDSIGGRFINKFTKNQQVSKKISIDSANKFISGSFDVQNTSVSNTPIENQALNINDI